MAENYHFSLRLIDWCTEAAVPIVYASSAATYGDGAQGFDDDPALAALRRLRRSISMPGASINSTSPWPGGARREPRCRRAVSG